MNRKNLTAAVLAGLAGVAGIAGTAQAVNINPDGVGQVLLFPYYTTNGGNVTLLSVVNTTEDAKAVKVRFLESENSVEVLDFNLYMSAYDVWTASIEPQPMDSIDTSCDPDPTDGTDVYCEGPMLMIAADENTCMVPNFGKMQSFLPFAYKSFGEEGEDGSFAGDGGTQDDARMNEGHFEMIEMGVLDEEGDGDFMPAQWATHTTVGGAWLPEDCGALNDAWATIADGTSLTDGEWKVDKGRAVLPPTGGLFGGAGIVNVVKAAMHTYEADAINGWNVSGTIKGDGITSLHTEPGSLVPNLDSGDILTSVVFSDQGIPLADDLDRSVDAVSYLFMHDSLMNEYVTDPGLAAKTEWVLTFPTKRFYVETDPVMAPFTTAWAVAGDDMYATACATVALTGLWDREERDEGDPGCEDTNTCETDRPPIVSPPPPVILPPPTPGVEPFQLCYETNVIRFGGPVPVDGDTYPSETEILGTPAGNT